MGRTSKGNTKVQKPEMKLADRISYHLVSFISSSSTDIVIPNWFHGNYEMDMFKLTEAGYMSEYEIKISRSDFFADFKKHYVTGWDLEGNQIKLTKHDELSAGKRAPNRFFFVVPEGLISVEEVPKHVGLIYFYSYNSFVIVKNAPLLHKNKFTNWTSLLHKLASREATQRIKLRYLKFQTDKEWKAKTK